MSRREARKSLLIKATTSASSSSSSPAAHAATSNQRGQLESLTRGKQQLHSIVGGSLFFFGKEANNNAANGISDALADAVLGEFDLARADFVFRLAAGDSAFVAELDKKLGKTLAKRGDDVVAQCAFVLSVDDVCDVYIAPSALDCATWCTAISNTIETVRQETLQQRFDDAKSRVTVLRSQIDRHEKRLRDDSVLPKSERTQLKSQIAQLSDDLTLWTRRATALHKQVESVRGGGAGRRGGSWIVNKPTPSGLDDSGRRRSSSIGEAVSPRGGASSSSGAGGARMFGQVVDLSTMTDAELDRLVSERANAEQDRPAPSVLRNTSAERLVDPQKQSKMCQQCHVQKAVAKVRVGGASEVLKLCNSCLEAMKKPGTTAVVSDVAAASSVMQDGVKKEGMMLVGVSHKQYLVVISDGTLSWYESKKSLEATNSLALADTVCDSFGELLFVQSGDTVYDFQCKSEKEVASWLEALRAAALHATTIDQRQPLARYKQRTVFPVRLMLALPGGTVRVVCNTKHTPDQAKAQLFEVARQRGLLETAGQFCAPEYYFLKYAGFDRILIDEYRPFAELPYINLLRDSFAGIFLVAVSKPELVDSGLDLRALLKTDGVMPSALAVDGVDEVERERSIQSLIHESLWHSLAARCDDGDAEINVVRCRMARFRMRAFAEIRDRLPEFINSVPRPVPCPSTVQVTCHLPEVRGLKTVAIDVQMRPSHIRDMMFGKMTQAAGTAFGKRAADFVLKVLGYRSYFVSEAPFIDFDYVRSCIHRGRRIELSLVEFDQRQALQNEPLSVVDAGLSANLQWIGVAERFAHRSDHSSLASPRGGEHDAARRDSEVENELQSRSVDPLDEVLLSRLPAEPFTMHVLRVSGCRLPADRSWPSSVFVFVECALYFGGALLCAPQYTVSQPFDVPTGSATFDGTPLAFQVVQTKMPKGARACLTVYACASGSRDTNVAKAVPLAWLGVQCFDWNDRLVQGDHQCRLWAGAADPIGTCTENFTDKRPMRLVFGFRRYEKTPVYSPPTGSQRPDKRATGLELTPSVLAEIEKDSLEALSETIKPELWRVRWCLRDRPRALAKLLQCVRWWEPADVAEAHALVREWRPLSSTDALELFDARYADPAVRAYAVERLFTLSDGALVDLLLQLVQVIKYEPYHDSPLARFLVHRALQAKDIVGYPLFWHLRSEAHVPEISQRFLLLTETYLRGCGRVYRNTLVDQVRLLSELNDVGSRLVGQPAEARARFLQVSLVDMRFPPRFSLPLFTDYECSGLELEKCRFMKSKKMPLWLTFANADVSGSPVTVMFKVGDDLRQDVLTLQMIKLMDKLWTAAGMNLGMTPYGVVATGPERGLVEVVLNSETMANINRKAGGAAQVFNPNVLVDWLREHNETDELFRDAQQRFALSAAGYAVATYVLGVGDRHNDNIMLNKNGAMFHIDFGHFLGHFKTKFGYEREKAPFVFTKQYAQILGGRGAPAYELFVTSACKAFNIVRKNCMLFINLFTMMISVGLPELRSRENVVYLRDMLVLEKSDADAERFLKGLIDESLRSFNTQVGEVVHILAN